MRAWISKVWPLVTLSEKIRLSALLLVSIGAAAMESIGIGVIFIFFKILTAPDNLGGISALQNARSYLEPITTQSFLLLLVMLMLIFFSVRMCVLLASMVLNHDLRRRIHVRISGLLFAGYLRQPYERLMVRSTSEIVTNITINAGGFAAHGVVGLVETVSSFLVLLAICAMLLAVRPVESLVTFAIIGTLGGLYWYAMRHRITAWGHERIRASEETYRVANEAVRGIKTLKVFNATGQFLKIFENFVRLQERLTVRHTLAQQAPPIFFQFILAAFICLFLALVLLSNQDLTTVIPTLALLGAAALRALPAMLVVLGHIQQLQHSMPGIERVHDAIVGQAVGSQKALIAAAECPEPIESIELDSISYAYDKTYPPAIWNVSLTVRQGEFVAFTGLSGSGKTTTADIILGLLTPTRGEIRINGRPADIDALRKVGAFGYVPQEPLVFDDTLRRNITLESSQDQIDEQQLRDAIAQSGIEKVVNRLPHGIDTRLGEWGLRLSGGERQRIGLARALYFGPQVLVLDEPTSSLDVETEAQIMACLQQLRTTKTIIMIAHRLTTIQSADKILFFESGRVSAPATFQELRSENASFRSMLEHMRFDRHQDEKSYLQ